LPEALNRQPQAKHKPRRLDGDQEAHLSDYCSSPPLVVPLDIATVSGRLIELEQVEHFSETTSDPKKNKPVKRILGNSPEASAEFVPDGRRP